MCFACFSGDVASFALLKGACDGVMGLIFYGFLVRQIKVAVIS